MASALTWLRLQQRVCDWGDLLSFSLCPLASLSTSFSVGSTRLQLKQWPGRRAGSGGWVWGASRRLASHFQLHGDGCPETRKVAAVPGRIWSGLKVLELGAGTGASGLAASVLGADVTLTDQESFCYPGGKALPSRSLLDLMRINVQQNSTLLPGRFPPTVCELLWGGDEQMTVKLPHRHYDLLCGSDILLFDSAHKALLHTLKVLSRGSSIVLIEHTDRSGENLTYPKDLLQFLRLVEDDKIWFPSVVRDHGRHLLIRMVRIQKGGSPFLFSKLPLRESV